MQRLTNHLLSKIVYAFYLLLLMLAFSTESVAQNTATLNIFFPNLKNLHIDIKTSDKVAGTATGILIKQSRWKSNSSSVQVPQGIYDLVLTKGQEKLIIDHVDCRSNKCSVNNVVALLTINFNGLNKVTSSIYLPDNIQGKTSGLLINKKTQGKDQDTISILRQIVDVNISKGGGNFVADNVDCRSARCNINNITAKLTIPFHGMTGVDTTAYASDGNINSVSGTQISAKKWQQNQTELIVLRQKIDLKIKNTTETLFIDNINCLSGHCSVHNLTSTLTIHFPNLNNIKSSVYSADTKPSTISGNLLYSKSGQADWTMLTVFKKKYDVKVQKNNSQTLIVDNVDCTIGRCRVDNLTANLTIKFKGMDGINLSVRIPDNQKNIAFGKEILKKTWQKDQIKLTVLRQFYDLKLDHKNSKPFIIDAVDCTSGNCIIDNITSILTVKFPQINGVHTTLYPPNNNHGSVGKTLSFKKFWQNNQAKLIVFKQHYDISVQRQNSKPLIIDNIDCTGNTCLVDQITTNLVVIFPKLSKVNTTVFTTDFIKHSINTQKIISLKGQNDKAIIPVLRQVYDVTVNFGSVTKIIDHVDCRSGKCLINNLSTQLTINFPGLQNVNSSIHLPDSQTNVASGQVIAKANWKTHKTTIPLLRGSYDLTVNHSITSIFDQVNCKQASCSITISGNVNALLVDGDTRQPLVNTKLIAYEQLADNSLSKVYSGITNDKGRVNFNLPGITQGKLYRLRTLNPFGLKKAYKSNLISSVGFHTFIVTADGINKLDQTPPQLSITAPKNGGNVSHQGFQITGTTTDNRSIDRVEVSFNDPITGSHLIIAAYDSQLSTWKADIPSSMLSLNHDIVLIASAFDKAQNQKSSSITLPVINDTTGPAISITSHFTNEEVSAAGFLLSGTVTDSTSVSSLQASLIDPTLGQSISNQVVNYSINNGNWTLVIGNHHISNTGTISISLKATDSVGNTSSKNIQLIVVPVDFSAAQMINRITFGSSPALVNEVKNLGAINFLEQQLDPNNINDNQFLALLNPLPVTKKQLQTWTLQHMIYSKRQLQEIMTWFWDNHFNTDINSQKTNANGVKLRNTVNYELAENQSFRHHALGNFRDLLEISAKSPAMLIYLDSISNVANNSNENYARELLELHSMGVKGGYTDLDIEVAAEIFTGWQIRNKQFFFNNNVHSLGSYLLFEATPEETFIPEGGEVQGNLLLDALAQHPSTATFICTKLITLFVNDIPPTSLIKRCAKVFINFNTDNNQIQQVLRFIMQSAEFNNPTHYRNKIKSPIEFVVGAVRNLDAQSKASDLIEPIANIGIRLYENPVPTGWSELGSDWVNSGLLIERMKWINIFVNNLSTNNTFIKPLQFYSNYGFETADGIVGFLTQLTVDNDITNLGRSTALSILGSPFDLTNPDAESRLRQLNGTLMNYPQYQFQ